MLKDDDISLIIYSLRDIGFEEIISIGLLNEEFSINVYTEMTKFSSLFNSSESRYKLEGYPFNYNNTPYFIYIYVLNIKDSKVKDNRLEILGTFRSIGILTFIFNKNNKNSSKLEKFFNTHRITLNNYLKDWSILIENKEVSNINKDDLVALLEQITKISVTEVPENVLQNFSLFSNKLMNLIQISNLLKKRISILFISDELDIISELIKQALFDLLINYEIKAEIKNNANHTIFTSTFINIEFVIFHEISKELKQKILNKNRHYNGLIYYAPVINEEILEFKFNLNSETVQNIIITDNSDIDLFEKFLLEDKSNRSIGLVKLEQSNAIDITIFDFFDKIIDHLIK